MIFLHGQNLTFDYFVQENVQKILKSCIKGVRQAKTCEKKMPAYTIFFQFGCIDLKIFAKTEQNFALTHDRMSMPFRNSEVNLYIKIFYSGYDYLVYDKIRVKDFLISVGFKSRNRHLNGKSQESKIFVDGLICLEFRVL